MSQQDNTAPPTAAAATATSPAATKLYHHDDHKTSPSSLLAHGSGGSSSGATAPTGVPSPQANITNNNRIHNDATPLSLQILSRLVECETNTLDHVGRIVELFHKPLAERGRGVLSFAQHWALFSNLGTLYESHRNIHRCLTDVLASLQQQRALVMEHRRQILRSTAASAAVARARQQHYRQASGGANAAASHHRQVSSGAVPNSNVVGRSPSMHAAPARSKAELPPLVVSGASTSNSPPPPMACVQEPAAAAGPGSIGPFSPLRSLGGTTHSVAPATDFLIPSSVTADDDRQTPSPTSLVYGSPKHSFAYGTSGDWGRSEGPGALGAMGTCHSSVPSGEDQLCASSAYLPHPDDAVTMLEALDDDAEDNMDSTALIALFAGPAMMHFLAEHMMYTLHCCRTIVPTMCALISAVLAARGSSSSVTSGSALAAFGGGGGGTRASTDAAPLLQQSSTALLGASATSPTPPSSRTTPTPAANATPTGSYPTIGNAVSNASSSSSAQSAMAEKLQLLAKYERFVHFTVQTLSQPSDVRCLEQVYLPEVDPLSTANGAKLLDTAPLEELLLHLASPLPSLQRYLHAARCLIEAQCLGESASDELLKSFVSVAYARGAQEGTLVLDQVSLQDVASITANFDDFTAAPNDNRVLLHSGRLVKKFRRGRHERLMFVFSDLLCYVEELSNGRHRVRGLIPLVGAVASSPSEDVQAIDVQDNLSEGILNAFNIVVPATGITYLFFAPSAVQKRMWLDVLRFAFNGVKRSKSKSELQQATGDVPTLVRSDVETLPRKSRLERQRRDDHRVQRRTMRQQQANRSIGGGGGATPGGIGASSGMAGSFVADGGGASGTSTAAASLNTTTRREPSPSLQAVAATAGQLSRGGPSSSTALRASVRRQASLRGSYSAAQWAVELGTSDHLRVRSSDVLLVDPDGVEGGGGVGTAAAQDNVVPTSRAATSSSAATFESFGLKMPSPIAGRDGADAPPPAVAGNDALACPQKPPQHTDPGPTTDPTESQAS